MNISEIIYDIAGPTQATEQARGILIRYTYLATQICFYFGEYLDSLAWYSKLQSCECRHDMNTLNREDGCTIIILL